MKKFLILFISLFLLSCQGQQKKEIVKKSQPKMSENLEYVTIGGGCFWCVQPQFEMLKGVESVVAGYAGGTTSEPTYEEVSTGRTGHAEVIQIGFDPKVISYMQLMDVFLFLHDPTQLNRQGNDVGTQYRSVVFYRNEMQKAETEKALVESHAKGQWKGAYVTQVVPFEKFWPGEDYHQDYYYEHPTQPYCSAVTGPKIRKFLKHYEALGWLNPEKVREP